MEHGEIFIFKYPLVFIPSKYHFYIFDMHAFQWTFYNTHLFNISMEFSLFNGIFTIPICLTFQWNFYNRLRIIIFKYPRFSFYNQFLFFSSADFYSPIIPTDFNLYELEDTVRNTLRLSMLRTKLQPRSTSEQSVNEERTRCVFS